MQSSHLRRFLLRRHDLELEPTATNGVEDVQKYQIFRNFKNVLGMHEGRYHDIWIYESSEYKQNIKRANFHETVTVGGGAKPKWRGQDL